MPNLRAWVPWDIVRLFWSSMPLLSLKLVSSGEPPEVKELATLTVVPATPEPFCSEWLSRNWNRVSSTALVPRMAVSVIWTMWFLESTFWTCEARLKPPTPETLVELKKL